jgi:hypothetical protein
MKHTITVDGVERVYTLMKEKPYKRLYEVETLANTFVSIEGENVPQGLVWYEIHYTMHDRKDREYKYNEALRTFNKPNAK